MRRSGAVIRSRTAALDGLRGVAILVVLVHHVRAVYAGSLDRVFLPGAFLGVDLFFVLSGFLITGLLLQEQRRRQSVRLGAFYRRRLLRLYPALVVLLAAHAIYAASIDTPPSVERSGLISILFYYFNWRRTLVGPEGLGHLWSLSVEEQFYLLWPIVLIGLLWLLGASRQRVAGVVALLVVMVVAYRILRFDQGTFLLWLYIGTDTRVDSLLVGALLAIVFDGIEAPVGFYERHRWVATASWIAAAVFVAAVLRARLDESFLYLGGFTIVAVACAMLVVGVLPGSPWLGARLLSWQPLCTLGIVSYGLYLWHLPVFTGVQRFGGGIPPVLRVGLALSITAFLTALSWYVVERPFLRWKDRIEHRGLRRQATDALEDATRPSGEVGSGP